MSASTQPKDEESENGERGVRNISPASLLYSGGTWRPPPPPGAQQSVLSPGSRPVSAARPVSALKSSMGSSPAQRPASAHSLASAGVEASTLFEPTGVLMSAALHTSAVEGRVLEQDARRNAFTIPDKTGSQWARPVSASFFSGTTVGPSQSVVKGYVDPVQFSMSGYDPNNPAAIALVRGSPNDAAHATVSVTTATAAAGGTPPRPPSGRPPLSPGMGTSYLTASPPPLPRTLLRNSDSGGKGACGDQELGNRWGPSSSSIGNTRPVSAPRGTAGGSLGGSSQRLDKHGKPRPFSATLTSTRKPEHGAWGPPPVSTAPSKSRPTSAPRHSRPATATAAAGNNGLQAGAIGGPRTLFYGSAGNAMSATAPPSAMAAWAADATAVRPMSAMSGSTAFDGVSLGGWGGAGWASAGAAQQFASQLPKKMPGSSRPVSAFSLASAAQRAQGASAAMAALAPHMTGGSSVAAQPVFNEPPGTGSGEHSAIMTSQDVIDYFTQHGHSAHKKLFYLNKAKRSSPYDIMSPFDLVVVPADKVEAEHWTMSVMGVVHMDEGDKEGEFMELGEWIRLSSIYSMLRKMRVFRHYHVWKGFTVWRANVRAIHYNRVRTEIGRQLYPAIPTFAPYIARISAIIQEITSTPVLSINLRPDKLYSLEEFVEDQDRAREKVVAPALAVKANQIVELLLELAGKVESERAKMEAMSDVQQLAAEGYKVGVPSMTKGQKNVSISALKAERVELLHSYKRVCHEVGRLRGLVRLVDYMVAEAYVALSVNAASDLLAYFEDPNKVRGCFNTAIAFLPQGGYTFAPDRVEVLEAMAHVVDQAVQMAHELPRPLTSRVISARFMQQGEQTLSVMSVALATPRFQQLRGAALKHVEDSFVRAQEYVHATFEDKRVIEEARLGWDVGAYDAKAPDLPLIRKDLLQQRRWGRTVDQMKMSNTVGVLFVDSKRMRSQLHDSVLNTLEGIKQVLNVLSRKSCATALERCRQWLKELEPRPADVDGYARLRARHAQMEKQRDELFRAVQMVDDMYDTYKDYGGKVELKDNVNLDTLHEESAALRAALSDVETWVDERHTEMVVAMAAGSTSLLENVAQMLTDMGASGPLNSADSDVDEMLRELAGLEARLVGLEEGAKTFTGYQRLMGEPQEDYGSLGHVRREFERRKAAWVTLGEWTQKSDLWLTSPVSELKSEEITNQVDDYFKNVYKMCKMYRDDQVVSKAKDMIDDFKQYLPLITEAANPAMQAHHWGQVFALLGIVRDEGDADVPFSVHDLMTWGAMAKLEQISALSASASKEYSLRRALARMKEEWVDKEFYCIPYKDTGTCVIGQTDEIQMLLDDQLMKVQAMNASPFVKPFKAESSAWEATLQFLQDLIDQWVACQATWMYLEPIFSSEDIAKQMPEEASKFSRVDTTFRALMEEVQDKPSVIHLAAEPERLEALRESNRLLEEVQKGLAAYLEKKRLFFPRFFFLSNDEMLEILSETKDPTRVQPHLRKCFEGIHRLKFDGPVVSAMLSVEGEAVPLKVVVNTAQAKGAVERWLLEVEERMFEAVHDVCARGVVAYPGRPRHEWVLEWPGQVVLVVTAVFWTSAVEAALAQGAAGVKACEAQCTQDLMKIVDLVRGELTGLQRTTLGALVVMDVHARDVVSGLVAAQVESSSDFDWQAQLRCSWEKNTAPAASGQPDRPYTARLRMMSSVLEYGYEYLGNSSRLVITPLTDRCYRTLMGAIHMTLGGAPEGPAGTGKTETTKDLAKALARQCVVFNCSDSLDYIAMGKFFKGLAASGAWSCFDEFNRIDLEVLSVVAQQVMDIQRAISAKLTTFTFEGTDMQLKWSAWVAITMNPGYAGRSELPDNLKALFRTVAMMVPDYAMIAEIMLFSYGYLAARESAKKIVQCYKLCSEQLSSQDHYDYGMRAVMAVLRAAGNLKRRFPVEDEYVLMLRSIMDVNLCKFLSHDVPLFQGIISDLFPGVVLPPPDYIALTSAIQDACVAMGQLQPTEYFVLKTIQLYEMIIVRHGLMIVGQPFAGKTASYRVLAAALTLMHERGVPGVERAQHYAINPKALTMGQLYGQFDPVSHEWSDGVLAVTFRKAASDPSPNRKWLVLDGPVDAIWIENMNTVLDDNKKLCLNSGEIIAMSAPMTMMFEVADLAVASPATVSRCGMVYTEPEQLGVAPLLSTWIASLPAHYPDTVRQRLLSLFAAYVLPLARVIRKEVKEASPVPEATAAVGCMRLWSSLSSTILGTPELYRKVDPAKVREAVDALFVFSVVFSLGATAATVEGRATVCSYLAAAMGGSLASWTSPAGHSYYSAESAWVEMTPGSLPPPLAAAVSGIPTLSPPPNAAGGGEDSGLPASATATSSALSAPPLHDWVYDVESFEWKKWTDLIDPAPASSIPPTTPYKAIIVPTADSATATFLLKAALNGRYPLLLVGPTGTGKTSYIQAALLKLDAELYTPPNLVGFSAQTSASTTQSLIDAKLDKRRKGVYGPPVGKTAVVFVDDLNMPQKEVYGAQPPIELLRQFMDHGGWYDRDNSFRAMQDVLFVAAMGPPGGGRTFITPRYTRHFHCVALTETSPVSLTHIFSTIQDWFLTTRAFPHPVHELKSKLISATMEVYNLVASQLLPTPTKSHYVFNLRDFSRVIQGVQAQGLKALSSGAAASGASITGQHIKLWCHEVLRVFYDRLVGESEQVWFLDSLKHVVAKHFKTSFDTLFAHLTRGHGAADGAPHSAVQTLHLRRLFFGDYLADMDETGERPYCEILDPEAIISKMEEYLMDFNSLSKRPMNLAMFLYAVEHVSRVARVLRQDGGHMMCVGVGGSGRQSLSRLASFIAGMEVFQIEVARNYGLNEWHEDLKRFCRRAGADNKPSVLLFSDTQIKSESFVEDLSNLLNAGEVPNLFPYDERTTICEAVRGLARKMGRPLDTPSELWAFFVERTKANLHVVLCFSPIGDAFRDRLRAFPSLINCCTIDWFQPWPEDALNAVAAARLKSLDVTLDVRTALQGLCRGIHTSMDGMSARFKAQAGRHNYVTPTSYLELLSSFTQLLTSKRTEVLTAQHRYETGLEKLAFTAEQVEAMRSELRALKPVLEKTVGETTALMTRIAHEKAEVVEPKKAVVDAEVRAADVKAQEARAIKEECEAILAEAIPALNAAIGALDTIKKPDIQLVASFKNPPAAVKLVMEAVCVLLDVKPTMVADPNTPGKKVADYWDASKRLLMDTGFLARLKEYDRDNIAPRIIDKVRKEYTSDSEFTPANAAKASSAAEGLCKWCHAMDSYDRVAKVVAPKRAALAEAEAAYESVMVGLRAKQAELSDVLAALERLESQLQVSMREKDRLEAEVELCTIKLERAEALISGLGGERDRWTEVAHTLRASFNGITGDMLVAAACISYLGAFTASYREEATNAWLAATRKAGITCSPKFSLANALGDPVKIREWVIFGLPNDALSIENAITLTSARRWPLCIDPQKQANKWIRAMEAENRLVVMKAHDADMRILENAITFGLPVLLENVGEDLDPSLEPLLLKQTFKQGHATCLKLGDSVVEYNDSFRFYITTALRNPHYLPETAVKVTLLNFMITREGLADQLLGVVVAQEVPELEEQRQLLVVQSADNKRKLKEIENQILHVLSSSQGNILEDASAVAVLSEAKRLADDIGQKQAVAEETQAKIDAARKGYKPCGDYCAVLFFCIADMAGVDAMYQYSLGWFIGLYLRSIADAVRSEQLSRRLAAINDHFTYSLYANVCRSLFEKDKLLFAFLLASRVLRHQGQLPAPEYDFLVTGGASADTAEAAGTSGGGAHHAHTPPPPNPDPTWISPKAWSDTVKLSHVCDALQTLPGQVSLAKGAWREVLSDSPTPHTSPLPPPFDRSLSAFQRLLVLGTMRPDKLLPAMGVFVEQVLGPRFTEPPPLDLGAAFAESSCTTPLLFVLSPGTDPTATLLAFADSKGFGGGKLQVISMGQGQGPKAAALIEDARGLGTWVLLQNCHLAPSWMPTLERLCEAMTVDNTDVRFRLWMTSMPSTAFPPAILQNCVKMTTEPPAGLRANMRRCLALEPLATPGTWEVEEEEGGEAAAAKASAVKRLLFGLVFIHAFVQERRRFGPIGWNIPYGFDDGDLRISARQARMYVMGAKTVPYAALQYAIGECNYGGRVTDDKDRRLLNTLMARIFCPELHAADQFPLSESGEYVVPEDGPMPSYISYVESLPQSAAPEVFGLHANADISKELAAAGDLRAALLAAAGGGGGEGGAGGMVPKPIVAELVASIPHDFDVEAAAVTYPVSYSQSMNQVLVQEMARYNRLLGNIRTSLVSLAKALDGLQVLSSELEAVGRSLAVGAVPASWKATSFPCLKPLGGYVSELVARCGMLASWMASGPPPVFWIGGFFFTPSFTTAVLQNYARARTLPIDSIGFGFEMLPQGPKAISTPPNEGAYIHGLYLEGCGWDGVKRVVCEATPKVLFVEAPVIWLRPARLAALAEQPPSAPHIYECPVYRTPDRRGVLATTGHSTNFLMMISLPSDKAAAHWTLRGVCMLCSLAE